MWNQMNSDAYVSSYILHVFMYQMKEIYTHENEMSSCVAISCDDADIPPLSSFFPLLLLALSFYDIKIMFSI